MARSANQVLALTLRKLSRAEQSDSIRRIVSKSHPADLAHVMRSLTAPQQIRIFKEIRPVKKAAEVLNEMEPSLSERILETIDDDFLALLIAEMRPDDVASILRTLESPRRMSILAELSLEEASEAEALSIYAPESAGALMSINYFVVQEETNAKAAINLLHDTAFDVIFYLYVINSNSQLVGVVSLRDLVRAADDTEVRDIMLSEVIRVDVETDQEEVARLVARYNLLALPVTSSGNKLIGVITVDDIIDVIRLEATEDIMHAAGTGGDISPNESFLDSFRSRVPWLLPSFLTGIFGVLIIIYYQQLLLSNLSLIALIPMVMKIAGHVGTQSSTLVTRWMATGRLEFAQLKRVIYREAIIGLGIGIIYGSVVLAISMVFFQEQIPGKVWYFAVGLSVVLSSSVAAGLGATIPIVFEKTGVDPAVATGPLLTTAIDIIAIVIYLQCSAFFLS